jgi:glycosyltransferase involved in cell wall biosynthesis
MACGLPVVSSNIGAVQEVTGDAAILVNPDNPDEIAEAVVQVLSSEKVRHSLIQKGLERSEVFSWDRCARETIEVYEELVYA